MIWHLQGLLSDYPKPNPRLSLTALDIELKLTLVVTIGYTL